MDTTVDTLPKAEYPRFFSLRIAALRDMALMLIAFLAVDYFFFEANRFWDVSPHPFWIIVILTSVQYGANEGLFAALLCTLALLVGNIPEQQLHQDIYEYLLYVSARPLMWFAAAIALGVLREKHIQERRRLRLRLDESERRADNIATAYERMREVRQSLERRIAGQFRTSLSAYQAARAMETLQPGELLPAVEELVKAVLNARKFSVFLLDDGDLSLRLKHGWEKGDDYNAEFTASTKLYKEVIAGQHFLNITREEDQKVLQSEGVIAGPLMDEESGQIIGMLKIEEMGFLDLNLSTFEEFKVLCGWIGAAYANAKTYETAKSDTVINPDHNLMSYGFFKRQTEYITALARRIGFDVTMIVITLENADKLSESKRRKAAKALSAAVHDTLRLVDQAFDHQTKGNEFAIILPNTPMENADLVIEKIMTALDKQIRKQASEAKFSSSTKLLHKA